MSANTRRHLCWDNNAFDAEKVSLVGDTITELFELEPGGYGAEEMAKAILRSLEGVLRDRPGADRLDSAGQTILQLLNKAANVAEQNSGQAIELAQKLSRQLRAAQQRISELEAEVLAHQWLLRNRLDIGLHCLAKLVRLALSYRSDGRRPRHR